MPHCINFFSFIHRNPIKSMAAFFLAFFLCAAGNTCTAQVSQKRQDFIDYALTLRGIPYKYAGFSKNGLDCSGMVAYAAKYGIRENLPRSASGMWDKCKHLKEEDREPGDLIFFAVKNTKGVLHISHVGIYLGMYRGEGALNGKRLFLHAASAGRETGVIISPIDDKYWSKRFYGYGRFLPSTGESEMETEAKAAAEDARDEPPPEDKTTPEDLEAEDADLTDAERAARRVKKAIERTRKAASLMDREIDGQAVRSKFEEDTK